jgi:hypothetical protein
MLLASFEVFAETIQHNTQKELQELKSQVQMLMNRISELEKQNLQAKSPAVATSQEPVKVAAKETPGTKVATVTTEVLEKTTVKSGNDKVRLTLSGQVDRAVLYADNGVNARAMHVDNDNYPTLIRINGEGDYNKDLKVGGTIELALNSNLSDNVDLGQATSAPTASSTALPAFAVAKRKLEVYAQHTQYGKLSLGQGDTASKNVSLIDLSGTHLLTDGAGADFFAGGIRFINKANNSAGPQIKQTYTSMDGMGRDDRIRYDTPQWMGFTASASHVTGDSNDVALRFSGEFDKTKISAGVTWANDRKRSNSRQTNGAISVLFPIGISITGAAGVRKFNLINRADGSFGFVKLGYQRDFFSFGKTAFAIDYGRGKSISANDNVGTLYGVLLVQNIDKIATEVYIGAHHHHLGVPGVSYNRIFALMTGARVKF